MSRREAPPAITPMRVVVVLAVAAGMFGLAWAGNLPVHPLLLALAAVATGAVVLLWKDRARFTERPWQAPAVTREVLTYDRRLSDMARAARTPESRTAWITLAPALRTAVTHRLADRHGIDAAADPQAARDLLPPELHTLLDPHPVPPRTTRDLSALVTRIEEL